MTIELSKFAFRMGQRVMLPREDIVQGIVSSRIEIANAENEYQVHYLRHDLQLAHIQCTESALAAAQPKKKGKRG